MRCIVEARIGHNMLVYQVATYSPICITMSLKECACIDGALLRDIEVYITNDNSLSAHALIMSVEEAIKQKLWTLNQEGRIPDIPAVQSRISQLTVSRKKTLIYQDTFENPVLEELSFDHKHIMAQAIYTTCAMGFILKDLNHEFCSRFVDDLLLSNKTARTIGNN